MRIDLDKHGTPVGVEITAPSIVTIEQLNSVLSGFGIAPLDAAERAPLAA